MITSGLESLKGKLNAQFEDNLTFGAKLGLQSPERSVEDLHAQAGRVTRDS